MMYLRGRQLDRKVLTAEENSKRLFNKRVLKTFLLILLTLGCFGCIRIVLFIWKIFTDELTLGTYIVQYIIGDAVGHFITVANPLIILRNRDVRDAWKERH